MLQFHHPVDSSLLEDGDVGICMVHVETVIVCISVECKLCLLWHYLFVCICSSIRNLIMMQAHVC